MKKINWILRLRSYPFWVAVFGFIGLIVTDVGVDIGHYESYVQALMLVLVAGGVVSDPTTQGLSDSKKSLNYSKPRKDVK